MDNRTIHWSVTTSTLIGERVAGLVYWFTALLVIGIVAIQVPKVLWFGVVFIPTLVWKLISFVRLRRVAAKLKAVRMVADECLMSAKPFTLQFELDASESLDVESASMVCEWRSQGVLFWVKSMPQVVTPIVSNGRSFAFSVSGLAPVLTRWVTAGVSIWFIRVKVLGTVFSYPLQLQEPRVNPRSHLIGAPK